MVTAFSVVKQVVNVAKMAEVKNSIIKSPRVAVINVKMDAGGRKTDKPNVKKPGILAFTLPEDSRKSKDLQNCEVGSAKREDDTILLVSVCAQFLRTMNLEGHTPRGEGSFLDT